MFFYSCDIVKVNKIMSESFFTFSYRFEWVEKICEKKWWKHNTEKSTDDLLSCFCFCSNIIIYQPSRAQPNGLQKKLSTFLLNVEF